MGQPPARPLSEPVTTGHGECVEEIARLRGNCEAMGAQLQAGWDKASRHYQQGLADLAGERDEARAERDRWQNGCLKCRADLAEAVTGGITEPAAPAQPGEWGILEVMGHRTAIGRISERELAGKPMLHVVRADGIVQWYSPESLYALTPCTEQQAAEAARRQYQPGLPYGLRAITAASDDDEDDADPWHSDGGDRVAATPGGTPYPVERDGETF